MNPVEQAVARIKELEAEVATLNEALMAQAKFGADLAQVAFKDRIAELEAEVERLTKLHETIASWDFVAKAYQKVYFEDFPTATLQRARMGSFCGRNWELEAEVERSK